MFVLWRQLLMCVLGALAIGAPLTSGCEVTNGQVWEVGRVRAQEVEQAEENGNQEAEAPREDAGMCLENKCRSLQELPNGSKHP